MVFGGGVVIKVWVSLVLFGGLVLLCLVSLCVLCSWSIWGVGRGYCCGFWLSEYLVLVRMLVLISVVDKGEIGMGRWFICDGCLCSRYG